MRTFKESLDWPIYRIDASGNEVETVYDITVNIIPGSPGRISGPPEDCYPPEDPEVEILSIKNGKLSIPERDWESYGFTDDEIEKVMAAALEIEGDDGADREDD